MSLPQNRNSTVDADAEETAQRALRQLCITLLATNDDPTTTTTTEWNSVKTNLLQVAQSTGHAHAFAGLGYWYETASTNNNNNRKRAVGCYTKAISLDPNHVVAGRGLLRLLSNDDNDTTQEQQQQQLTSILERAVDSGWAWTAWGRRYAVEGYIPMAVVALVRALRCHDLQVVVPSSQQQQQHDDDMTTMDTSVLWYMPPNINHHDNKKRARAETTVALAACYRWLGRYTAAVRSYQTALELLCSEEATYSLLILVVDTQCRTGHVELELGLLEDALHHFEQATNLLMDKLPDDNTTTTRSLLQWAQFGRASALLALSRRDFSEGKCASSFGLLQQAIGVVGNDSNSTNPVAIHKLLGDAHSFAALLPTTIFSQDTTTTTTAAAAVGHDTEATKSALQQQLDFVARGAANYRMAMEQQLLSNAVQQRDKSNSNHEQQQLQQAIFQTDIGANLYLQWQLLQPNNNNADDQLLLQQATHSFQQALDISPTYAAAWCGLGCALAATNKDPLLAQYALVRAIQLDPLPDSYSNLSLILTQFHKLDASVVVLDALTQVADTPMNWIHRALILTTRSSSSSDNDDGTVLPPTLDAYKAALQVEKHPCALRGAAVTHMWWSSTGHGTNKGDQRDSLAYLQEYLARETGAEDIAARQLRGLLSMELALDASDDESAVQVKDKLHRAREELLSVLAKDEDSDLDAHLLQHLLHDDSLYEPSPVKHDLSTSTSDGGATNHVTISRQIVHAPNRGELWLELAKEIVLNQEEESSQCRHDSSLVAVSKAIDILEHEIRRSHDEEVNSRVLSSAYAVRYWQDQVSSSTSDCATTTTAMRRTLDLQRSLLLDPSNCVARQAISVLGRK